MYAECAVATATLLMYVGVYQARSLVSDITSIVLALWLSVWLTSQRVCVLYHTISDTGTFVMVVVA